MKTISLKLVGTKPLMVHNPRVVDPFDKYKKLLQPLTSKRTKTDDDLLEICRLQFLASLYYRNGEYVLPQSHVEGSFKLLPKNVSLARSLSVPSAFMVMVYCNSRTTTRHRKNFLRLGAQRRVILTHQLPMLTQERAVSKVLLKSLQQERYFQNGQRKLLAGSMRRS